MYHGLTAFGKGEGRKKHGMSKGEYRVPTFIAIRYRLNARKASFSLE